MNSWLAKSEPGTYSWDDLVRDKKTNWDGVRNYQARNNLGEMKKGDLVFFYHSGEDKAIMGISEVSKGAFPDPSATEGNWLSVELKAIKKLKTPITLAQVKANPTLSQLHLVRNGRLSVMPVNSVEMNEILKLAGEKK